MTRIIIIRHGQSIANARNLFAGHSDFDLTDFGKEQARRAALYIKEKEHVDVIYSSDLLRAYHTACPIGEILGLPINKDTSLREIYGGKWEAMAFPDIALGYPEAFFTWKQDYSAARPVDGESTAEVYNRVIPHVLSIAKKHDGETVVLATHATVLRAFDAFARGYSSTETGKVHFAHNASINIYECDGEKASVVKSDITEHLGELISALPKIINA